MGPALEPSLLRRLRLAGGASVPEMEIDGQKLVQFSSNNYFGLSVHPRVIAAAKAALDKYGAGAGASALISGHMRPHAELEEALAHYKGTESALVFASGSMANLGALSALLGQGDTVWLDKACHATLYDGARLSGAELKRFPHGDFSKIQGEGLVVVERIYSMDGDACDIGALRGRELLVDEAHSTGLLEPVQVKVVTGTLSKALGSQGGFVAGSRELIELLVNKARSYIFATALAPASAAAALEALRVLHDEGEWLERLRANMAAVAAGLRQLGWPLKVEGPIFPVIVGSAENAMSRQAALLKAGFFVPAIRPPTVPAGLCRLRLSVSALHAPSQIERLLDALGRP